MSNDTLHIGSTTARLHEAWQSAPAHLKPVLASVRNCGVGVLFVPQDPSPFRVPRGRPAITILGDDFETSKGPEAFHLPSLRRAMRECVGFAVVASRATAEVYTAITAGAVAGGRVMIVETRPAHEIPWVKLIQKVAPKRPLIWPTVRGGRA